MKICFATNNKKKLAEVQAALPDSVELVSLAEIGCTEVLPETGETLEHNAFEKASYVFEKYGVPCFADDTGLEVSALGGAPGVHAAYYAGEPRSDARNVAKLAQEMRGKTDRHAAFRTVIALILEENERHTFIGEAHGHILEELRGTDGFGYDPLFVPEGQERTFAEMSMEEKNQISHRGKAVRQLVDFFQERIKKP
ncbi:putative deoxyribonucleoside-triphosphatase [Nitritalea halalkaliphila LW7]|uniref:dITP/XTP pyrophosphatase n=1 Tax=Nitritalea halalkaliphila LW7 TaxID=1189621 RepID=I5C5E1_9BACT|nr:RdgB/HAM1 family non-canonical purine NTP pyrophosphatase [Nitritalea halalkaliphila]EIM77043.1 putative deoxyribonucleoside-triphosphatase [Nitritalea halalkaliphila LW7]